MELQNQITALEEKFRPLKVKTLLDGKFDKNNLVSITRFKDGKELVNVLVLSQDAKGYMPYYSYTKERNEDNLLAIEYIIHFLNVAKGSVINEKNIFRSNDTFLNYEVISPTYWKYRDRDYKSENDKYSVLPPSQ